jgi:uronate dehydrogenase
MPLVLVTGATGEVARGVLPFLDKDFDLRLLSLDPPGDDPRRIQADMLDWDALARAMNGVDAVLHLAVASGHSGAFEDEVFNTLRFDVNVKGTYHVFATARRLRIPRVVHVSSVMVVWGHLLARQTAGQKLIAGDERPWPIGTYALTKMFGEQIAGYFGKGVDLQLAKVVSAKPRREHPLHVLVIRIAAPLDLGDPELRQKPVRPQQIPFPDLAQAFAKALTVPLPPFAVVTVTGVSSRQAFDLEPARRLLGYAPAYGLDDLGVTFASPDDVPID